MNLGIFSMTLLAEDTLQLFPVQPLSPELLLIFNHNKNHKLGLEKFYTGKNYYVYMALEVRKSKRPPFNANCGF